VLDTYITLLKTPIFIYLKKISKKSRFLSLIDFYIRIILEVYWGKCRDLNEELSTGETDLFVPVVLW